MKVTKVVKVDPQVLYKQIEDKAWAWYNKEIAYNVEKLNTELVLLKGFYEGKQAIKIPAELDNHDYRKQLESKLGITIRKRIFDCSFDLFGNNIFDRQNKLSNFHTYLFMYHEVTAQ